MPDIRNFFGGKGSQGISSSQEQPTVGKGRGKRKILNDSEDELEGPIARSATPQKVGSRKKLKHDSPTGQATTTSDYFATSNKSKPTRSTPTKPKVRESAPSRNPSTKSTPTQKLAVHSSPPQNGRASSRRKTAVDYAIESNDEDEASDFKDPTLMDDNETSEADGNISQGLKRKSSENPDGKEDMDFKTKNMNGVTSKAAARIATPRRKKIKGEPSPEPSDMKDIFDSIPTVRPPTPPRDTNTGEIKKFDFRAAASRSQPAPAAGSLEIPAGAENCLSGLTFVFTGLLEALGREEGQELVKRYGGKVTTAPSSKTSFVILGNDAGPKKLDTIKKYSLKTINETGLFDLIRKLPANGGSGKAAEKFEEKKKQEEQKTRELAAEMEREERKASKEAAKAREAASASRGLDPSRSSNTGNLPSADSRLWTVKYAPTSTSMICGNKTQVDKLQAWLRTWPRNLKMRFKMPGKDGMGIYRAVIIHGPPGIGKTTAAHLAAKLEGYDVVESNASDSRSKKLVESGLRGVLDTTSLFGYFAEDGKKVEREKKKLVLIMDEVDGMSAGDRGGVGALAAVCKKTNIPMILICNDRKLPKMAPFDRVTYDLPFRRPTIDQIRSRIMTICFREQLKIPSNVINALIEGTHADIRQIINMLSTAKLDQEAIDFDTGKKMSKDWEKHIVLKPWDIVGKILGGGLFAPSSKSNLNDKIELYFNDHEFSSLMLQENYLGTNPILAGSHSGKKKSLRILELTDMAAESISDGDLVDRMIHGSQQQWALMPTHAVFGFVRPASFVSGSQAGHQTRFTTWLGNNSKHGKLMRFIKEIQGHMRLRASGDRHQIRQEYLPLLWQKLVKYLEIHGKEGVEDVIPLMDSYFLTKDDWDAMVELGVGPMSEDKVRLDTQTKATFTRLYNQQSHPLPFMKASQVVAPRKIKKDVPDLEEAIGSEDEDIAMTDDEQKASEDEELDLKKDKYVRAPSKKTGGTKKAGARDAKGKTKGKAKSKAEGDSDSKSASNSEAEVKPKKGRPSTAKAKGGGARAKPKK